ncbi:MAG: hypothetical protein H7A07_07125 [Pseudomonadales bacterium]|nr:hypothetical protein [Pseudomonadales bacterium]
MRALIFRALVVTALLQGSGVFAQDHVHPSTVDTAHQHEMPAPQAEPAVLMQSRGARLMMPGQRMNK